MGGPVVGLHWIYGELKWKRMISNWISVTEAFSEETLRIDVV